MNIGDGIRDMLRTLEVLQAPQTSKTHRATFRGKVYPCSLSSERRGEHLTVGGWESIVTMTIRIRKELFAPVIDSASTTTTIDSDMITVDADLNDPRAKDIVELTTRNRKYRIAEQHLDPTESYYSLVVVDAYRP